MHTSQRQKTVRKLIVFQYLLEMNYRYMTCNHMPLMKSRTAGFTLMEMMVAMAIIATSAALAAPGISLAMARRRATQAQLDVLRVGRAARSSALGHGRAFLMRYTDGSDPGQLGRVQLFRGDNSGCNTTNWVNVVATGDCSVPGPNCVGQANMGHSQYMVGSHEVLLRSPGQGLVDICYAGDGSMWHRFNAASAFSDQNTVNGGIRFTVQRRKSGAIEGVTRWIVFPIGGSPRVLR